jgi:hypothetical protein
MDKREEYRRFAYACLEMARSNETPQDRATLQQMALVWSRLAELIVNGEKE